MSAFPVGSEGWDVETLRFSTWRVFLFV